MASARPAAVLFDLLGDREAAEFFAKMAAAGYSERERGHTGNFFNMLWAMQGVARCGPLTSGAYLKEQAWYYDLARSWDTRFIYQGSPVGEEEHGAYKNWDCSGSYLLDCALPLKSLRITGQESFQRAAARCRADRRSHRRRPRLRLQGRCEPLRAAQHRRSSSPDSRAGRPLCVVAPPPRSANVMAIIFPRC
jgi:hypothetical protein